MEAVDEVNEAQKQVLVRKIRSTSAATCKDKTLAVWGLAFKPRTDDIREAPALMLIDALLAEGVQLRVHDPEAMANVRALYGDKLVYCDRPYGALEGADGLVIVTEWQEFRNPDFEVMAPAARPHHLRRPQPVRPQAHGGFGVHLSWNWAEYEGVGARQPRSARVPRPRRLADRRSPFYTKQHDKTNA